MVSVVFGGQACIDAVPPLSHRQVASSAEHRNATCETEHRFDRPTATMCHATSVPWLNIQERGSTVTLGVTVIGWRSSLPQKLARLPLNNLQPTDTPSHSNFVLAAIAEPLHRILASAHRYTAVAAFEGLVGAILLGFRACGLDSTQPAAAYWVQGHMSGRRFGEPNRPLGWWGRSARAATLEVKPPFRRSRVPLLAGSARSNLSPRCFLQKNPSSKRGHRTSVDLTTRRNFERSRILFGPDQLKFGSRPPVFAILSESILSTVIHSSPLFHTTAA